MPRAASSVGVGRRAKTPTLLAARGITAPTSRSQSRSHAYLFCALSHGFSRKRETARSLAIIGLKHVCSKCHAHFSLQRYSYTQASAISSH